MYAPIETLCLSQAQGIMKKVQNSSNCCNKQQNYNGYYNTQGLFIEDNSKIVRPALTLLKQKPTEVIGYKN